MPQPRAACPTHTDAFSAHSRPELLPSPFSLSPPSMDVAGDRVVPRHRAASPGPCLLTLPPAWPSVDAPHQCLPNSPRKEKLCQFEDETPDMHDLVCHPQGWLRAQRFINQMERGLEDPPTGPFTLLFRLLATSVPTARRRAAGFCGLKVILVPVSLLLPEGALPAAQAGSTC